MRAGAERPDEALAAPPDDVQLPAGVPAEPLAGLAAGLAADPHAPIAPAGVDEIWRTHVADSLTALELGELSAARRIADLGSGAGLPGLALAIALPGVRFDLLDSVARKARFAEELAADLGLENVTAVAERSEQHARGEGREAYDVVTARAVAPLAVLAELASPLLREGGCLVAWKGEPDAAEEADLARAGEAAAMRPERVVATRPYAASRSRHLHVVAKSGPTPEYLPRRPGVARKRPLRAAAGRDGKDSKAS